MHERRRDHDGSAVGGGGRDQAAHAVGKATLTQALTPVGPVPAGPPDPAALTAKVQAAALAGHAQRALDLMATVARPEQLEIAAALGPEARHSFARHVPTSIGDSHATRVTSQVVFEQTPDAERPALELLFEARFRLQIGSHPIAQHGRTFDPLGLRQLWSVYADLPADQVAHNWAVAKLDRYHDTDDKDPRHAHGAFGDERDGSGEMDLSYRDSIIRDGGTTDHDRPGDPLYGVNRFDEVARHEVGHAVDRELGLPSFNILGKTDEAGQWQDYFTPDDYRQAAEQMVGGSAGAIHRLPPAERADVIDAMVASMAHSDTSHFRHVIDKLEGHHHGLQSDPVYRVMTQGLASQNPWLDTHAIAGRHYHQAYAGADQRGGGAQWVSYSEKAYASHRLSEYQFRAVQEWFAEAYTAFYTPVDPGEPKGKLLQDKLPQTHSWFVHHVDNRRAVAKESKEAQKTDHPPKKP
jgi:hypothetical protein